jgi:hypothetical protein
MAGAGRWRSVRQLSTLIVHDRAQWWPALVFAFGAAPNVSKPAVLAGPNRPGLAIRHGLNMKNAVGFLLGFVAMLTPILIYVAWVVLQIAEAI